jgi:iron-sulfur cluster assembly protein
MITVSDKAKERILELKKEEGRMEQENIRVSVKGGGCSGLMYELGFDAQLVESDHVFEDKGVKILVDKKSLLYLVGTTLEFSDHSFINPITSNPSCGSHHPRQSPRRPARRSVELAVCARWGH